MTSPSWVLLDSTSTADPVYVYRLSDSSDFQLEIDAIALIHFEPEYRFARRFENQYRRR